MELNSDKKPGQRMEAAVGFGTAWNSCNIYGVARLHEALKKAPERTSPRMVV